MFDKAQFGRVRYRTLGVESPPVGGTATFYLFGNLYQTTVVGGEAFRGYEKTWDATHPYYVIFMKGNALFRKSAFRNQMFRYILKTGGQFKSDKIWFNPDTSFRKLDFGTLGSNRVRYSGTVSPCTPAVAASAPNPINETQLMDMGAKQLLYNLPTKPLVGISQTLAELKREGLPKSQSLSQFKDKFVPYRKDGNYDSLGPRRAGEDYLTWQFGFRPVIQDIYDLATSIDTADKQWRMYVKAAEKLQRRHFEFPVETSTKTEAVASGGSSYPVLPTTIASGQTSTLYRTRTTVTKRRFSAAYAYALPSGAESTSATVRKVVQYKQQYGLNIDPALLWELTPWSWLIDWFLPVGNFIQSVSSLILGNTACPWAYISEHTEVTDVYERPGVAFAGTSYKIQPLTVVSDYKRRMEASPFGFGVSSWKDLSPLQLSILAAIGITR